MWGAQVAALQDNYRLIVPDLRGFGGTDGFAGEPSTHALTADLEALLAALAVQKPVVLVGSSYGSIVALAFAHENPGRVRGLILTDPWPRPSSDAQLMIGRIIGFLNTASVGEFVDLMMSRLVSLETINNRPDVVAEIRRLASLQTPAAVGASLRALLHCPDPHPLLSAIAVPTLVIAGAIYLVTPPGEGGRWHQAIKGAKLVTIPGAAHFPNLERPDLFNDALLTFLGTLSK
jgi:pimeloyl-ACP methyl ester carboxylesterase